MSIEFKFSVELDISADQIDKIILYQSNDGLTWDQTEIDFAFLVNLNKDIVTGQYIWTSILADIGRWSFVKTKTIGGYESDTGLVFPPQSFLNTTISANKVNSGNDIIYNLGEIVSLMLEIDSDYDSETIGDQITVQIKDYFNNIISQVIANKIPGTNFYETEYKINKNLQELYNRNLSSEVGLDNTKFILKDVWILNGDPQFEFSFLVNRVLKTPTEKNGVIRLKLNNIESSVKSTFKDDEIYFTTELEPFYQSVETVINTNQQLESIDKLSIIREILYLSEWIDSNLKPNFVKNKTALDQAIKCYIKNTVALNLLSDIFNVLSERKKLDAFEIEKSYDNKHIISKLEKNANECKLIILAGGLNTPFVSTKFSKGLYDPNRPNVSRASLDSSVKLPFVNTTTAHTIIIGDDGDTIELRGTRTLSKAIGI